MAPHIFPFCVFLEDTDAYEMVFNNRYMQYATRALGDLLGWKEMSRLASEEDTHMYIREVLFHRFLQSAVLGDYCQVETVLYKLEDMKALFLIKMARLGNGNTPEAKPVPLVDMIVELGFNDEFGPGSLPPSVLDLDVRPDLPWGEIPPYYLKAVGTESKMGQMPHRSIAPHARDKCAVYPFVASMDMLDCNRDLNTQFVMHLYERSRNPIDPTTRATCLASKSNTDCLRVVVRWDKVRFNHYGKVLLGDELEIRTAQVEDNEKNIVVVFHALFTTGQNPECIAHAIVTIMFISSTTKAPMAIPRELNQEVFAGDA
ncbi:hypothetical protein CYMTET_16457 [Cymbomonas tetramitiformis]|uniref:Uncharacterized protein n=1 Tax=Cymbomonas tetramitiformis TaxID=36881 RepID=A0AAE0GC44_9CHLO|nr:hypothetical protein CYMTET_16457 [Cymbomonas tetramitiformis]